MTKNMEQLMNESKVIAQNLTPLDTGNLRYNSYRAYGTPTGFRITSLFTVAFYGGILDTYGARTTQQHKGWWSTGVYTAVATYIHSSLNNRQSSFEQANANVSKFAANDPERRARYYNSMVADKGRDKFLAGV